LAIFKDFRSSIGSSMFHIWLTRALVENLHWVLRSRWFPRPEALIRDIYICPPISCMPLIGKKKKNMELPGSFHKRVTWPKITFCLVGLLKEQKTRVRGYNQVDGNGLDDLNKPLILQQARRYERVMAGADLIQPQPFFIRLGDRSIPNLSFLVINF
jgi:hypothetical protein